MNVKRGPFWGLLVNKVVVVLLYFNGIEFLFESLPRSQDKSPSSSIKSPKQSQTAPFRRNYRFMLSQEVALNSENLGAFLGASYKINFYSAPKWLESRCLLGFQKIKFTVYGKSAISGLRSEGGCVVFINNKGDKHEID